MLLIVSIAILVTSVVGQTTDIDAVSNQASVLAYPADNSLYPSNANLGWLITAPVNKCIRMRWTFMSIEIDCSYDYVVVYDDDTWSGSRYITFNGKTKLCGSGHPPGYYYTTGRYALVNFRSNSNANVGNGFKLEFEAIDCECFSTNFAPKFEALPGKINSLSFPNDKTYNYPSSASCFWNITGPSGKCIRLRWTFMSIENDCSYDYVSVFDDTTWSGQKYMNFNGRTKLCGTGNAASYYYTRGPNALVTFNSNSYATFGSNGQHGFTLEYEAVDCECFSTELSPQFEAPTDSVAVLNYPKDHSYNYPSSATCFWNITAPSEKCIRLKWDFMSIENDCSYDYVAVYDDTTWTGQKNINFNGRTKLCGTGNAASYYYTRGSNALVTFASNTYDTYGSNGQHGFTLSYQAVDCECKTSASPVKLTGSGTLKFTNDQSKNYPSSANCWWNIVASGDGKCLRLQYDFLSVEADCSYDYVSIYDDSTWSSNKLISFGGKTKLCGTTFPREIHYTSGTNALVNFVSNAYDTYGSNGLHGFTLSYATEMDASKCGKADTCKTCVTSCY